MRNVGLRAAVLSVAIIVALSTSVSATTVNVLSEKVLINRGGGYAPIGGAASVNPGDMVMASPSGSAEIVYDDGCRKKVDPGSVVTISGPPPCTGGAAQSQTTTWYVLGAAAIGGIAAGAVLATGGSSGNSGSAGGGGGGDGGGGPASP